MNHHLPYVSLAIVLYLLLSLGNASIYNWYNPPFSHHSDLTVHVPRAFQLREPTLFTRDPGLTLPYTRLDSIIFPWLLTYLLPLFGLWGTLVGFAFILGLIFVLCLYTLSYYLSNDPLTGVIAAFFGAFGYKALGWSQLDFSPEFMIPRTFIVAISPLIILLFLHWRNDKKLLWIYATLGLLANFHVLAALHWVFILTLTLMLISPPGWALIKRVGLLGLAALIPALPSVIFFLPWLGETITVTAAEAPVILTQYLETMRPRQVDLWLLAINFLPLGLFGAWGFYEALRRPDTRYLNLRVYFVLYLVVLGLPWIGFIINLFTLSLTQLELLRITRYYFMLNFIPVGMLLSRWLQTRRRYGMALTVATLAFISISSRYAVGAALIHLGYDWLRPRQVAAAQLESEDFVPRLEWHWESFAELTTWIDANTPIDAVVMTPADWGTFWTYARRAVVVSDRIAVWSGWAATFETVKAAYAQPDPDNFIQVAQKYKADYVVVMTGLELPGLRKVYENDHYALYQTQ